MTIVSKLKKKKKTISVKFKKCWKGYMWRLKFKKKLLQQYEYDVDYYETGGPLFFYINDAGTYTTEWITHGLAYDISRELNGALFTTDLRYFRLNLPTP